MADIVLPLFCIPLTRIIRRTRISKRAIVGGTCRRHVTFVGWQCTFPGSVDALQRQPVICTRIPLRNTRRDCIKGLLHFTFIPHLLTKSSTTTTIFQSLSQAISSIYTTFPCLQVTIDALNHQYVFPKFPFSQVSRHTEADMAGNV